MSTNDLKDFALDNLVYDIATLIDGSIKGDVHLWNYNENYFINAATRFSKETLLHQYIACITLNWYSRDFLKNGDLIGKDELEVWRSSFDAYQVKIKIPDLEENADFDAHKWFEENEKSFNDLFDKIAEEVFHILLANRGLLLKFNELISETVIDTNFPPDVLTKKGTIKRMSIPKWAQIAIFHRDKGRCVFCNCDLTNIFNTLNKSNFDHIVPLDQYGCNDPCNLQLTCDSCNKKKSNRPAQTSNLYIPWWQ